MIRTNPNSTPTRRIAVIGIPRPQQTRLGMIRPARPAPIGWVTVRDEGPESTGNFLANAIMRQRIATQQTPGTLLYTPACTVPPQNFAPWNTTSRQPIRGTLGGSCQGGIGHHLLWLGLAVGASVAATSYLRKGR